MRKFFIISMLFIIVLCSNLNQSFALEGFTKFELTEYKLKASKGFEDAKKEFLNNIVDNLYKDILGNTSAEAPKKLQTEMIIPAQVFVDISTLHRKDKQDTYTVYIKTVDDITTLQYFENMKPEDINSRFCGEEEIKDGNYKDSASSKTWEVFFKVECEMTYVGDEYILKLMATDISKKSTELSIKPEDLVEPKHQEKDPGIIGGLIQGAENIGDGIDAFNQDPFRYN